MFAPLQRFSYSECNLKPFYPSAEDLESQEGKMVLDIFQDSSDEKEVLGF